MSVKWSALPPVVSFIGTDLICVDAAGVSSKITMTNFANTIVTLAPTATPRFARLGLGLAASATIPITTIWAGGAGDREAARFDVTTGNPYITTGNDSAPGQGGFLYCNRAAGTIAIGMHFGTVQLTVDGAGNTSAASLTATNNITSTVGDINCQNGNYRIQGNLGQNASIALTGGEGVTLNFIGGILISVV